MMEPLTLTVIDKLREVKSGLTFEPLAIDSFYSHFLVVNKRENHKDPIQHYLERNTKNPRNNKSFILVKKPKYVPRIICLALDARGNNRVSVQYYMAEGRTNAHAPARAGSLLHCIDITEGQTIYYLLRFVKCVQRRKRRPIISEYFNPAQELSIEAAKGMIWLIERSFCYKPRRGCGCGIEGVGIDIDSGEFVDFGWAHVHREYHAI